VRRPTPIVDTKLASTTRGFDTKVKPGVRLSLVAERVLAPRSEALRGQAAGLQVTALNFTKGDITLSLQIADGQALKDLLLAVGQCVASANADAAGHDPLSCLRRFCDT
jgi:hypothetical protein